MRSLDSKALGSTVAPCPGVGLKHPFDLVAILADIVWLLFLMKDMSNLDLASRMIQAVELGFKNAHGPGLQRLTALKGEFCAEKLLYVRLHLLQVCFVLDLTEGVEDQAITWGLLEVAARPDQRCIRAYIISTLVSVGFNESNIRMSVAPVD